MIKFGKFNIQEITFNNRKNKIHYKQYKHGYSNTKEYITWTSIKQRCYNKNYICYKRYGGRGIKVCDRWLKSFENFLIDMGSHPGKGYSIDRIDNDDDYKPENCRWATPIEQIHNRSCSKKEE